MGARDSGIMTSFNLIVTHLPGYPNKRDAIRQLTWLLDEIEIVDSKPNILLAKVSDPIEAVKRLRRSLPENTPILRVIPVLRVVYPRVEQVRDVVHNLLKEMPPGSFAIKIDGHLYDSEGRMMHKVDSAQVIAEGIERPVNLRSPEILVYIKIVRFKRSYLAAIYVGRPENILSISKLRETS
jgi:tRNA acetyltransferase TAN1